MTEPALRALVVDDEPLAVERLSILCDELAGIEVVGSSSDPTEAIDLVAALAPDVVFLDIAMPEVDGFMIARAAATTACPPAIVFCTAFEQFAVQAFAVAAVDYLLKPVARASLGRAVERVRRGRSSEVPSGPLDNAWAQYFWIPHRQRLLRVATAHIDRIEAERDYMRLHLSDRSYLLRETIAHLSRRLDPGRFVRVHRSHIVRRDFIVALAHDGAGSWSVELSDGKVLRVGRHRLGVVRRAVFADDAVFGPRPSRV